MRNATLVAVCLFVVAPAFGAGKIDSPSGRTIVSADAQLEFLFKRMAPIKGGLTEGPAVAPDGSIYFSDIPFGDDKGLIMRFNPKTGRTTVFTSDSSKSNGMIFDSKGYLIACEGSDHGGRRVTRWNVKTGERTTIADRYQGKKFNAPNDLCLDRKGRIYFTDPRYLGTETRELKYRAVYRIDTDGTVIEITHNITKPNGIALSPDGKTLYVVDHDNGTDRIDPTKPAPKHGPMAVYTYPLGADGKVNGKRRTLVDFGAEAGSDGITVDERGNIYLTVRSSKRPGVMVVNPEGKEIAFIPTGVTNQTDPKKPTGRPSNVEFGIGSESNVLYITVDTSLFRIALKVNGYHVQYRD